MTWILVFLIGLLLSAFFSGAETGFYRATRVRLVLDGLSGDLTSRILLWLTNHPALFVATTLIGNNVANYVVSVAVVHAGGDWFGGPLWVELAGPVIVSPFVFIYGELLPKNLFLHAPNFLMRRTGPVFMTFAALFLPVSLILWALSRALTSLSGGTVPRNALVLARRELSRVFDEGHVAGVLGPTQRRLAQQLIENAQSPVSHFATPIQRAPQVRYGAPTSIALRTARKHSESDVLVLDDRGEIVGYVQAADLLLSNDDVVCNVRPVIKVSGGDANVSVLTRLYQSGERQALICDEKNRVSGLVSAGNLCRLLLSE